MTTKSTATTFVCEKILIEFAVCNWTPHCMLIRNHSQAIAARDARVAYIFSVIFTFILIAVKSFVAAHILYTRRKKNLQVSQLQKSKNSFCKHTKEKYSQTIQGRMANRWSAFNMTSFFLASPIFEIQHFVFVGHSILSLTDKKRKSLSIKPHSKFHKKSPLTVVSARRAESTMKSGVLISMSRERRISN